MFFKRIGCFFNGISKFMGYLMPEQIAEEEI